MLIWEGGGERRLGINVNKYLMRPFNFYHLLREGMGEGTAPLKKRSTAGSKMEGGVWGAFISFPSCQCAQGPQEAGDSHSKLK